MRNRESGNSNNMCFNNNLNGQFLEYKTIITVHIYTVDIILYLVDISLLFNYNVLNTKHGDTTMIIKQSNLLLMF